MTKKYAIGVENVHLELVVYNASVLSGVKCMEGKHYLVEGETIFCSWVQCYYRREQEYSEKTCNAW